MGVSEEKILKANKKVGHFGLVVSRCCSKAKQVRHLFLLLINRDLLIFVDGHPRTHPMKFH